MSATTSHADAIEDCARRLREAWRAGLPIAPVRDSLPDGDQDAAYAVQARNAEARLAAGARQTGCKIGLTSRAVQQQLGVDQPDYGLLFDDMEVVDGDAVAAGRLIQPRVEAEVAFVMRRTITSPRVGLAETISAIDYALPAIEIVDSRIADWRIGIVDTIADNASAGLFTLGAAPKRIGDFDLRHCGMVLELNGEPTAFGAGAACLGSPINALLWLARRMAALERPLREGDVVLSGALGPMAPVRPGDRVEARINGLGRVSVVFEPSKQEQTA